MTFHDLTHRHLSDGGRPPWPRGSSNASSSETRIRFGKRLRPPPPPLPQASRQESQTGRRRFTKASAATASTTSTRVGSALQRVSKLHLFQRPNSTARPSSDRRHVPNATLGDAEDATVPCLDGTDSDESPVEKKTPPCPATIDDGLASSKPPIFIRNLWKKPLQTFRRRHQERSIPAGVEETTVECREDTSPLQPRLSDVLRDDSSRTVATTSLPANMVIDPVTNADDSITHHDENNFAEWIPPVPRKRKPKKPKHGDDSVLIGMTIIVDPTIELLELGRQPRCVNKSNLMELQKAHGCSLPLLGRRDSKEIEEEESTEASPSTSMDLLAFQLDGFDDPSIMMTESPGNKQFFTAMTENDKEDNEITFHHFSEVLGDIQRSQERHHAGEDEDDEIEIVFYRYDDVCAPHHGEDDGPAFMCTGEHDDDHDNIDEQSRTSEGSSIPLEWMLPQSSNTEVPQYDLDLREDVETPEYEWFLPDHLGIPVVNRHSPRAVFGELDLLLEKRKAASCTPSTAAETEMTFDFQATSYEEDSQGSRDEVLSHGSLPSEAVRSLLDFCQMGETRSQASVGTSSSTISYHHQHNQHHHQGEVVYGRNGVGCRSVSESIRIISLGIDF